MKQVFRLLLIMVVLQVCSVQVHAQVDSFKTKLIADVPIYRDIITEKHPDPFRNISKKEFLSDLDGILARAAYMNNDELFTALMEENAKIGDEHSFFFASDSLTFPFQSFWFEEGMYITATDSNYLNVSDSRITEVNGMPIEVVAQRMSKKLGYKNPMKIKYELPFFLSSPLLLHGFGIIKSRDTMILTLSNNHKSIEKFTVLSCRFNKVDFNKKFTKSTFHPEKRNQAYWYDYDTVHHALYFEYARCVNDPKKPFFSFRNEMIDVIEKNKPAKLIINLRNNPGGNSSVIIPFLEYLAHSYLNVKGKIYVLIGRRTFSSGILNAAYLKKMTEAILVGEETGDNVNHFGEVKHTELPNSHLHYYYSTKYFEKYKDLTGPLHPDVVIPVWYENNVKGFDQTLDYAIKAK